jgi:hypothetical protein
MNIVRQRYYKEGLCSCIQILKFGCYADISSVATPAAVSDRILKSCIPSDIHSLRFKTIFSEKRQLRVRIQREMSGWSVIFLYI